MSGYSGTVFEPADEYKGDFARTYFYMATAYEDKISSWSSPMLAGNKYPAYANWALTMMLRWAEEDPVSDKEIARNNAVYDLQNNRNPSSPPSTSRPRPAPSTPTSTTPTSPSATPPSSATSPAAARADPSGARWRAPPSRNPVASPRAWTCSTAYAADGGTENASQLCSEKSSRSAAVANRTAARPISEKIDFFASRSAFGDFLTSISLVD